MSNVTKHSTLVPCSDGLSMALDVYTPAEASAPLPTTVVCHGFKGFKDWGFFPALCERLAARGRALAIFDFSHNGVGNDTPGEFSRLDLFEAQTVPRHVEDLGTILDFLDDSEFAAGCNLQRNKHYNVVGHSLGGGVGVVRASDDGRITQVATLNGVSHFERVPDEQKASLEMEGRVMIPNARTGQDMPLGKAWFETLDECDVEEAAEMIFVPALVIQGGDDASVTPDEGEAINSWIPGSRLVVVDGADHVFGAKHPFEGWTPQLETVATELDEFLPHLERLGGI